MRTFRSVSVMLITAISMLAIGAVVSVPTVSAQPKSPTCTLDKGIATCTSVHETTEESIVTISTRGKNSDGSAAALICLSEGYHETQSYTIDIEGSGLRFFVTTRTTITMVKYANGKLISRTTETTRDAYFTVLMPGDNGSLGCIND